MPLPVFDTADAVPEAFRPEYEEREGKWHPKVPDVTKLNSALDKERARAEEQERLRKAAERERDELKRAERAKGSGITEEQLEAMRVEDANKRKAELDPIATELTTTKEKLRKVLHTDRLKTLALANGVMPDRLDDAMLILERRTDLTADGEEIVVKDKEGKVTTEKVADFLAKTFKAEKPWLYAGTGSTGSGAGGSNGSGTPLPQADADRIAAPHKQRVAGAF